MRRRLAAILAADIVGYSKLVGENEAAALAALRRLRSETLRPLASQHHGQIVKSMGDGWLIAFRTRFPVVECLGSSPAATEKLMKSKALWGQAVPISLLQNSPIVRLCAQLSVHKWG